MSDMLGGEDVPTAEEKSGCAGIVTGILITVIVAAVIVIVLTSLASGFPQP